MSGYESKIKRIRRKYRPKLWKVYNFGTKFKGALNAREEDIACEIWKDGFSVSNLETLNINLPEPDFTGAIPKEGKEHLLSTWGQEAVYDKSNPFMALAEDKTLRNIAGSYLGYNPIHDTLQLNLTLEATEPPQTSQLWHRDGNDEKMLKIFFYLNDVDEKSGALKYLQYSHTKFRNYLSKKTEGGRHHHIDEGHKNDIVVLTGKKGTVIFADTSGLHCGGYVTEGERKMLTIGYVTRAGGWRKDFIVNNSNKI